MSIDQIINRMRFAELQQVCPGIRAVPSFHYEVEGKKYFYLASHDIAVELSIENVSRLKNFMSNAAEVFELALKNKDVYKMNKAQIDVDALSNIILELTDEWIDPKAMIGGWN